MDSTFTNEQIDLTDLPQVEDLNYEGLDKRYLRAELIGSGIFWAILIIITLGVLFFNADELPSWLIPTVAALLITLTILSFSITVFGFRKKKYALREKDIVYSAGLFWRSHTVLPFNRVQHAEVQQGPIERIFELGKLKIYTAGGSGSDMSISGLPYSRAQKVKQYILKQTSADEEE